jgi:hypothetical protein
MSNELSKPQENKSNKADKQPPNNSGVIQQSRAVLAYHERMTDLPPQERISFEEFLKHHKSEFLESETDKLRGEPEGNWGVNL